MGSPLDEPNRRSDESQVEVTLSKGFFIGKFEVTQGEWKRVCGEFPTTSTIVEGDNFPMNTVNYAEAQNFCRKLTESGHASGELPKEWEIRLPTEAEWEYACRAGTTTATSFGVQLSSKQANIKGEPFDGASPAGSYQANAWGLHDMHGNVFEWCRDWYHSKLPGGVDPDLSSVKGTINRDGTYSRTRRGGAWNDEGWYCRSAVRFRYEPERRSDHIGFRVAAVKQ